MSYSSASHTMKPYTRVQSHRSCCALANGGSLFLTTKKINPPSLSMHGSVGKGWWTGWRASRCGRKSRSKPFAPFTHPHQVPCNILTRSHWDENVRKRRVKCFPRSLAGKMCLMKGPFVMIPIILLCDWLPLLGTKILEWVYIRFLYVIYVCMCTSQWKLPSLSSFISNFIASLFHFSYLFLMKGSKGIFQGNRKTHRIGRIKRWYRNAEPDDQVRRPAGGQREAANRKVTGKWHQQHSQED